MSDTSLTPAINFIQSAQLNELLFTTPPTDGNHRSFIIEAAKERGLAVKNLGRDHIAFTDEGRTIGGMYKTVTSLVSHAALSVADSRPMAKEVFAAAGIPVPRGRSFTQGNFDEAFEYFQHRQDPAVVKPAAGKANAATSVNLNTAQEFRTAWSRAVEASSSKNRIMVEQYISGVNIRAYVVADRVVASVARVPAFVTGNGQESVTSLIEAKTALRAKHPYLQRIPIQVDTECLAQQNLSYTSVPEDGAVVLLNDKVNVDQGGEPIDVTAVLSPEIQELAVRAAQSIPGLIMAGIDLIAESPAMDTSAVVLRANAAANIALHHIPAYGAPVDVAGAIIDQMIASSPRPPTKQRPPKGRRVSWKESSQRVGDRINRSLKPKRRPSY